MKREVGLSKSSFIARTLEQEIRSGRMARGHRLASEAELVRRFAVSRNTVRKGLEELARSGLITTRTGIGSFVTYEGASIDDAAGWTLALAKSASTVKTKVLRIARDQDGEAAGFLGLSSTDFLCVDRLRILSDGGLGLSLERSRSPWRERYRGVLEHGLTNGSLGETFREAGLFIDSGEEWANVMPALPEREARLMGRNPGEAMLHTKRVTRDAEDQVIEYVESILDPSRFGLHLEF